MMVDVNMAVRAPSAAPRVVLTAASDAVRPSALELTSKTDPKLNPYQPNQRPKVPRNYVLSRPMFVRYHENARGRLKILVIGKEKDN